MFNDVYNNEFGMYIKKIRLKMELSQDYVSENANISSETLRRIEKGVNIPTLKIIEELSVFFKRDLVKVFVDIRENKDLIGIYQQIDDLIINYNKDKLLKLKDTYLEKTNSKNTSQVSFDLIQFKKIIGGLELSYSHENGSIEALEIYEEALKISIKDFILSDIEKYIYSYMDLKCLFLIALELNALKEFEESNMISLFLFDYIENRTRYIDNTTFLKIKIILNISYNFHGLDDDTNALKYSNLGIEYCLKQKIFYLIHCLYYRKAVALYYLEELHDLSIIFFEKAIIVLELQNMIELRDIYIKITEEKYDLIIEL